MSDVGKSPDGFWDDFQDNDLTGQWWLLVALFTLSLTLLVVGLVLANTALAVAGVAIGTLLYLSRRYFRSD